MKKNSYFRAVSLLLCLVIICSFLVSAPKANADNSVQNARNSVVRFFTLLEFGNKKTIEATGTGFFVGAKGASAQYIVTNRHVVDIESMAKDVQKTVTGYRNAKLTGFIVLAVINDEVYEIDYANNVTLSQIADLAIVKLSTPVTTRVPATLGNTDSIDVTDTVYAIGFPGYADVEDKPVNVDDSLKSYVVKEYPSEISNMSVTKGSVVKNHVTVDGIDHIQHDAAISGGNSGGPLVDESGAVLGMSTWGVVTESATANYAIDVSNIKTFLKQNNVPFIDGPEKPAAVTQVPAAPEEPAAPAAAQEEQKTETSWGMIIGIVAAILAVAAVAVIMSRKKTGNNGKTQDPVSGPSGKPDAGSVLVHEPSGKKVVPIIRSMAQQHGNRKIALGSDAVLLGRSSECKIIYKEGTPGVSGKHCAVTWDPNNLEFIIKDMGSTYGTFLDSGMKLDPSKVYRLKPGESFYLGERANTVKLEVE